MSKLRTIYKNINVINTLLIITLVLFVLYAVLPLMNAEIEYKMSPLSEGPAETPDKSKEPSVKKNAFQSDYIIIAERNLFHPERKIPEPEIEAPAVAIEKPDFVLYGTMVIGDVKIAYMEDLKSPLTTPGRGKRQRAIKKGNKLSGYTLSEVYQDRVFMVKETAPNVYEDSIEVNIIDASKPKNRNEGAAATVKPTKIPNEVSKELRRKRVRPRPDRSRG